MVKSLPSNAGDKKRCGFDHWLRKIPWSRKWQATAVFLPGKFHGQRSLAGYSLWDSRESDMTEQLSARMLALAHTHTHTHARTRARTHARTHTHTHMYLLS